MTQLYKAPHEKKKCWSSQFIRITTTRIFLKLKLLQIFWQVQERLIIIPNFSCCTGEYFSLHFEPVMKYCFYDFRSSYWRQKSHFADSGETAVCRILNENVCYDNSGLGEDFLLFSTLHEWILNYNYTINIADVIESQLVKLPILIRFGLATRVICRLLFVYFLFLFFLLMETLTIQ